MVGEYDFVSLSFTTIDGEEWERFFQSVHDAKFFAETNEQMKLNWQEHLPAHHYRAYTEDDSCYFIKPMNFVSTVRENYV